MKTKELSFEEKNEMFRKELEFAIVEYLTQVKRTDDYNIEKITNELNKLKVLDTMIYDGRHNMPKDYVLTYFERIPKPSLENKR